MEDYPLSKLVKEIISTSDDSYELFLTKTKNLNSNEKKLLFEKLKLELNTDINLTQFVELEKQKGSKLSNESIATKFNQFRKISAIVDEYFNSIQYSIYESIYTQHLTNHEIENIKQLKKLPKEKRKYNVKERTGFRTLKWNADGKLLSDLHTQLEKNKFISKTNFTLFRSSFSGIRVKSKPQIVWLKKKTLLGYLILELMNKGLVEKEYYYNHILTKSEIFVDFENKPFKSFRNIKNELKDEEKDEYINKRHEKINLIINLLSND